MHNTDTVSRSDGTIGIMDTPDTGEEQASSDTPRPGRNVGPFKQALKDGATLEQAMSAAGYAPNVARMGRQKLSLPLLTALEYWERLQADAQIGRRADSDPDTVKAAVKGALLRNMYSGKPEAEIMAAKQAGSLKEFALFQADNLIGVAVYQVSPRLEQLAAQLASEELPTIEATTVEADTAGASEPEK